MAAATLRALCDEAARIFKGLTGYDRVMVYRFDDEGHGEVLSEAKEPALEAVSRQPLSRPPTFRRSPDGCMSATACGCCATSNTRRRR